MTPPTAGNREAGAYKVGIDPGTPGGDFTAYAVHHPNGSVFTSTSLDEIVNHVHRTARAEAVRECIHAVKDTYAGFMQSEDDGHLLVSDIVKRLRALIPPPAEQEARDG